MEENRQEMLQSTSQQAVTKFDFFDSNQFAIMQRYCKMYASSDLVPDSYKITTPESENKAIGNCMIAMDIALRIGASPLMVMQNMVPIYGRPSWSSKFLIATINVCGRFKPLKYKIEYVGKIGVVDYVEYNTQWETGSNGRTYKKTTPKTMQFDGTNIENIRCTAYTSEKNGDEILEGTPVDLVMAIKEGWYTKAGSKWQTMPLKMLKYRAASFWANEYAPEISMGIYTTEENEDMATVDAEAEVLHTKINEPRAKVEFTTKTSVVQQEETPQRPVKVSEQTEPMQTQGVAIDDDCGY